MGYYDDNGFYQPTHFAMKPKESEYVDYFDFNPDHCPSHTKPFCEPTDDGSYRYVLVVRGWGVIVMRGVSREDDPTGRLEFKGVSVFSDAEIGHRL